MSAVTRFDSQTTVTIASAGTTSAAIDGQAYAFYGLIMPGTITSTAMTFTVSDKSDGTFVALYDETNTQVSVTIAASRAYNLPDALAAWPWFKIVMGSSEAADRSLILCAKG